DRTVDKIIGFENNGEQVIHTGNYSDYQDYVKQRGRETTVAAVQTSIKPKVVEQELEKPRQQERLLKMSYKEQRDYESIETWIMEAESEIENIATEMEVNASSAGLLIELSEKQQQAEQKLEQLMDRWAELNELADKI